MEKIKAVRQDAVVYDILCKAKGEVCKEFEKVCLSEMSFQRMKKEMHDIFDQLFKDISPLIKDRA